MIRTIARALGALTFLVVLLAAPSAQAMGDGGFVRLPDGRIFRIVGGAPLYVSSCSYSGCTPIDAANDLSGYATYPRDGAMAANHDNGATYRFVGGAAEWISRCTYGGGCSNVITVDAASLTPGEHVRQFPADGSMMSNADDGGIYRFVDGAPEWLSHCDYGGGCGSVVPLDAAGVGQLGSPPGDIERMRVVPRDGAIIHNVDDGGMYRIVGGSPQWISRCDYGGGCAGAVDLDDGTFVKLGSLSGATHLRSLPSNGTYVRNHDNRRGYRFAGGAPLMVGNCTAAPCRNAPELDARSFALAGPKQFFRRYPSDGTYLRVNDTKAYYRVAGHAALPLSDCKVLDGACAGAVDVDGSTITSLGGGFLGAGPIDGTLLNGRPGLGGWMIIGGHRRASPLTAAAIGVNDSTLQGIPLDAPPPPTVIAPALRFAPVVASGYRILGGRTSFTKLIVRGLPAGSKVSVRCSGRGCRFKRRAVKVRHGRAAITPLLRRTRLRPGAVLRVDATSAAGSRTVVTFKIRGRNRLPAVTKRCAPASGTLRRCTS